MEPLPSDKQPIFDNRVGWAHTYPAKTGSINNSRREHFVITERDITALNTPNLEINNLCFKQFDEFIAFKNLYTAKENLEKIPQTSNKLDVEDNSAITPDEPLRNA
ncbi:winged helix-turn-helix domain-containing protein [Marinomonas sp. A79]|uniref:Winged helix-turn-helix domain-containing protein n=1 Tax=Marinomonas vulgaris TaxID=2823372 RepID=A0ABS5HFV5_9GAMM|nr:winged helix-turn-helix domain-containing protein [Marinomonas vulgaris]MBR7890298.1 winged helix-turn-helix domain-containing protein [Marinomonas vulgaris]